MKTPEEFVDELIHAYDPAKAREYYLRTRKLKGRRRGSTVAPISNQRSTGSAPTKKLLSDPRAKSTEERVAHLRARLDKLKKVLEQLVEQAKARSGVEPKSSSNKSDSTDSSSSKGSSHKSAAQKKQAAENAKEYREKQKKSNPASDAKEIEAKIKDVREKIAKMKADIAKAKEKAASKPMSNSQTAPVGR